MANEGTFTPDVAAFGAWSEHLKAANKHSEGMLSNFSKMRDILADLKEVNTEIIPDEQKDAAHELYLHLLKLGIPLERIKKLQKEITDLVKEEADNARRGEKEYDKTQKKAGVIANSFKKAGDTVKATASSLTGIQFSLLGIIALFLKIKNETDRIRAYSTKIEAQWGSVNKEYRTGRDLMGSIQKNYKLSYDAAGEFLTSLAKGGMEQKEMNQLAEEMLSIEKLQNVAAADQLSKMSGLVNSFGLANTEAQNHLVLLREEAETLGEKGIMMSMEEYVNTWSEMIDKTKVYNKDLLATTALYNTLIKKADQIGFDEVPVELRKDVAKTIAGFGAELDDGMKSLLGRGETIEDRLLEFEGLDAVEKFKRFGEEVIKRTSHLEGSTKKIFLRKWMERANFTSKEMQKVMADAFSEGAFSAENFQKTISIIQQERLSKEKMEERAASVREELLRVGKQVSADLVSLETEIKQWVNNKLRPLVTDLTNAINDLIPVMAEGFKVMGEGITWIKNRWPNTKEAIDAGKYVARGVLEFGEDLGIKSPALERERQLKLMRRDISSALHIQKPVRDIPELTRGIQYLPEFRQWRRGLRGRGFDPHGKYAMGMMFKDIGFSAENINALVQHAAKGEADIAVTKVQMALKDILKSKKAVRSAYQERGVQ